MSEIISHQTLEQARRWLLQEVEGDHRTQLETWLHIHDSSLQDNSNFEIHEIQDAIREIRERFGASLKFGTAGLRGEMGVGSNRMNTTVVRRTSMGIAKYLLSLNIEVPLVVIGYDARINSIKYAVIKAKILNNNIKLNIFLFLICDILFNNKI